MHLQRTRSGHKEGQSAIVREEKDDDLENMAAQQKDPEQLALARTLNHTPTGEQYERMISGMLWVSIKEQQSELPQR